MLNEAHRQWSVAREGKRNVGRAGGEGVGRKEGQENGVKSSTGDEGGGERHMRVEPRE